MTSYSTSRGAASRRRTLPRRSSSTTSALYVAFRSPDPEPPVAHLTQRDADLFSDDAVVVLLDSFFDRQTAYYFATNPLGAQADGRVADDGRTLDSNWDGPWRAAARSAESGWSAEFAIPLSALKYVAGYQRRKIDDGLKVKLIQNHRGHGYVLQEPE